MILSRKHFELADTCVIEKLIIQTPFRLAGLFQNEACFIYMHDGQATVHTPNEKLLIDAHESILLRCGQYLTDLIQRAEEGTCVVFAVHLHPEILRHIYADEIPAFIKPSARNNYAQKFENLQVVSQFVNSLTFYFENPQLVNDELLRLKLKELILLLLQTKSADTILELVSQLFSPRQATIHEIITAHLFNPVSIEELATLAGLSASSFKREFQKQYQESPAKYIIKARLHYAAELLNVTTDGISEVAYRSGFNDVAHFSRTFKSHFNQTPTEYRQTHRANNADKGY